jgi:hypothetical protein
MWYSYDAKYPVAGRLDVWDEPMEKWQEMSEEECGEFEKGCTIM